MSYDLSSTVLADKQKRLDKASIDCMAGHTSRVGNPFLLDFILVAQRLEQLGFTYFKGKVIIVELVEGQTRD
jgi:hypothetical protein